MKKSLKNQLFVVLALSAVVTGAVIAQSGAELDLSTEDGEVAKIASVEADTSAVEQPAEQAADVEEVTENEAIEVAETTVSVGEPAVAAEIPTPSPSSTPAPTPVEVEEEVPTELPLPVITPESTLEITGSGCWVTASAPFDGTLVVAAFGENKGGSATHSLTAGETITVLSGGGVQGMTISAKIIDSEGNVAKQATDTLAVGACESPS